MVGGVVGVTKTDQDSSWLKARHFELMFDGRNFLDKQQEKTIHKYLLESIMKPPPESEQTSGCGYSGRKCCSLI